MVHQPSIARDEYDAFAALLKGDLPATYDGWLERCAQERTKALAQGRVVNEVKVNAQEFADYCRRSRLNASFYTLGAFVVAKSRNS